MILVFRYDFFKGWQRKNIRQNKKGPSTKQANNCAINVALKGCIQKVKMVPTLALECIVTLDSRKYSDIVQDHQTIS